MSQGLKYAELPGLDTAPDTYETTAPDDTASQTSDSDEAASHKDTASTSDPEDVATSTISRAQLQPGSARQLFHPFRVNARTSDFSDRLSANKPARGYQVSRSRRRRRGKVEEFTNGAFSDEEEEAGEEDETWDERLARLKRETEELRADSREHGQRSQSEVDELSRLLQELDKQTYTPSTQISSQAREQKPSGSKTDGPVQPYPADYTTALHKATGLEERLAALESALGIHEPNSASPSAAADLTRKPLLAAIALLDRRMTSLSTTTAPALDALDRQIQQLTVQAQTLSDTRRAAREEAAKASAAAIADATRPRHAGSISSGSRPGTGSVPSSAANDRVLAAEQARKIDELYAALPTIESLAPLVPAMLTRLKSLRAVHAGAATAAEDLKEVTTQQAQTEEELGRWQEALEKLAELVAEGREKAERNGKAVRDWVESLEARVEALGK